MPPAAPADHRLLAARRGPAHALAQAQASRGAARRDPGAGRASLAAVQQKGVIAIPKAANEAHVRDNRAALDLRLTRTDLAALDAAFPPPKRKLPLATS